VRDSLTGRWPGQEMLGRLVNMNRQLPVYMDRSDNWKRSRGGNRALVG
jgi:hypothetical protein